MKENHIEWYTGEDRITACFTQAKFINKVKKLAAVEENEVDFVENKDGSRFAHLPLKALKLSIIAPHGALFQKKEKEPADDVSEN